MREETGLAVAGATALLGPELTPVPDSVVVVEGATIVATGARKEVAVPADATVIDASGTVMVPGFIDSHVHIGLADPHAVLRGGVTTVRDLAWPPEEIVASAQRSRRPDFLGPLILCAGPMLTVEGGYPITASWAPPGAGVGITSEDHARARVAELHARGVAVIKIALNPPAGAVLPTDLLTAIVATAHERGLKVTGHIHGLDQLERALGAGIDELAHMLMSPEALPDDTIARMVESDVAIVPTLSIFPAHEAAQAIDNLARFVAAGGRVVYGTDLGNEGPGPGIDRLEVTRMAAAGLSVTDIVRSATIDAARWLGLERKGSIEPGHDADLVCVAGPLDDAAGLTAVRRVFRAGRAVL